MKKILSIIAIVFLVVYANAALAANGDPVLLPVNPSDMADGDYGDFSASSGTFSLDADVVGADELADGDYGDVSFSGGAITIDANAVQTDEIDLSISPVWTGAHDFGGATSLEGPNGESGTTNAAGEFYFDTNGDGSTVTNGAMQWYNGSANIYVFGSEGFPTADNQIMKYDETTHKVVWEADVGGNPGSFGSAAAKTIASGVIDLSGGENFCDVTTEGDAADDLTEIQAAAAGDIVVLQRAVAETHTITVKDGTYMKLQADFLLDDDTDKIVLICTAVGANDTFEELSRASNN